MPAADPNNQTFSVRPMSIEKWGKELPVQQPARANFDAVSKTGAVPVFDLTQSTNGKTLAGTGTLYRCSGRYAEGIAAPAPAAWVSVTTRHPTGLLLALTRGSASAD